MIRSFRDKQTEAIFHGLSSRQFQEIQRIAQRKLKQLNAAAQPRDLAMFPGNHLEALKGNRRGQY
ncbi:MAG: excinuclease ABC subunit A, partial [Acidobacteria bacterium]